MRLAELYALDIVDRFRPQSWGSPTPFHWVLGPLGAALVAAETGVDLADLSWRRTLAHDLAASQRLAHLVGLNGFFTGLLRSARTRPGCYLDEWWSERRCAREWGEVVRPDGYGIWTEHGTALPFLLEYDNGTEPLDRLAAKLARLRPPGRRRRPPQLGPVQLPLPPPRTRRPPGPRPPGRPRRHRRRRTRAPPPTPPSGCPSEPTLLSDGLGRLGLAQLAHIPLEVT